MNAAVTEVVLNWCSSANATAAGLKLTLMYKHSSTNACDDCPRSTSCALAYRAFNGGDEVFTGTRCGILVYAVVWSEGGLSRKIRNLYHFTTSNTTAELPRRTRVHLKFVLSVPFRIFSNFELYASLRIKCEVMFAFYFTLYTWLDFALSHFAFYNCPFLESEPAKTKVLSQRRLKSALKSLAK